MSNCEAIKDVRLTTTLTEGNCIWLTDKVWRLDSAASSAIASSIFTNMLAATAAKCKVG